VRQISSVEDGLFEINSPSPSVAVGNLITYYCILGYYGRERTYFNELLNLKL
jgi:hypothetical protein